MPSTKNELDRIVFELMDTIDTLATAADDFLGEPSDQPAREALIAACLYSRSTVVRCADARFDIRYPRTLKDRIKNLFKK